jgi:hypothetical protein
LTGGFHLAWAIGAGAVGLGALIAVVWLRPPTRNAEVIEAKPEPRVNLELEAA